MSSGAIYYISNSVGTLMYSKGRICDGDLSYQCYASIPAGVYILRLGKNSYLCLVESFDFDCRQRFVWLGYWISCPGCNLAGLWSARNRP